VIGEQQTIPNNWVMSPLCEVADINPKLDKSAFVDDVEVSFVPMPAVDVETGKIDVSQKRKFGEVKKGYTPFKKGDVLFAKITPCMENGKMAVVPDLHNNIGFGSTEFHVLRYKQGVEPRFLYYFISSKGFRFEAEHNMTGAVGQRRVPTIYLEKCSVPLPPSKEQQRIVSKLEELFSELDKGIEFFKTAREQLKVYRQAVLKHAFEGKLTEGWRKKHADELEPAETLLKKIKAEREQRYRQQLDDWEQAVKVWEASGKEGKKPTKPRKAKELPPLTEAELKELPGLPKEWGWIRLGTVIDEPKYGTSKKCSYESSGIGVLRIPNIVGGAINAEDLKYAIFDDGEKETYSLEEGDLLVIRSNGSVSIVGQTALVKGHDMEYLYAGYLIRIRPNKSVVDNKYLNFLFTAHMLRSQIESKAKSTSGVNNINSGELQSLINPVCSVVEQQEIVQQIESRISAVEKLEQDIEDGLRQAETLRQSLLKKAFEGRLVRQDPNDEPASVLLERIKAEKAEQVKKIPPSPPFGKGGRGGDFRNVSLSPLSDANGVTYPNHQDRS